MVFFANMYMVGVILLLCINYYLQVLQLQTNTVGLSCFALGIIIILPLGIIVLSWESKWENMRMRIRDILYGCFC